MRIKLMHCGSKFSAKAPNNRVSILRRASKKADEFGKLEGAKLR